MTNATQLEGTLAAVKTAVAAINPNKPDDADLLNGAKSAIVARIDKLIADASADAAAPNGCAVSLAVDGASFRCAYSVTPRKILI
jgi:hypothetical protein